MILKKVYFKLNKSGTFLKKQKGKELTSQTVLKIFNFVSPTGTPYVLQNCRLKYIVISREGLHTAKKALDILQQTFYQQADIKFVRAG